MLILFDQATPVPIRPYLEGHTVRTAGVRPYVEALLSRVRPIMPAHLEVVSPLENIVEDLKPLPPARLEVAADP